MSIGLVPVVAAAGIASKVTKLVGGLFSGQSAGFQQRQAASNQFFDTRNAIFAIEKDMSPQQLAEWKIVLSHFGNFSQRRENQAERDELYAFVKKLADPNAWPASGTVVSQGGTAVSQAGFGGSWLWLLLGAGLFLPMLLSKRGKKR